MSIRTVATLAVAVFLGLIAVLLVRGYLASAQKGRLPASAQASAAPVVVAASAIGRGAPLDGPALKLTYYPADARPAGAFSSIQQLTAGPGRPRIALRALQPNEPILASAVSGPGGRLNLSGSLVPGMRAIAIRASDVAGVGGFVLPGDRVDVLLSSGASGGQGSASRVVASGVRVLAVDQTDDPGADKPQVAKSITVEVTPAEAQAVALGQSLGQVSLALRQAADQAPLESRLLTMSDLGLGASAPRPPPLASAPAPVRSQAAAPLYGPGMVRVTRGVDTTGYRLAGP